MVLCAPVAAVRIRIYLGKIERGEINVTVSNLARVAKGLKCSISDLFPRERSARAEQSLSEIIALLETKDANFLKTSLALLLALAESSK